MNAVWNAVDRHGNGDRDVMDGIDCVKEEKEKKKMRW